MKSILKSLGIIGVAATLLTGCATSQHKVTAWEYKVITHTAVNTVEPELNALGEDGWILVSAGNGSYYLKRPKK